MEKCLDKTPIRTFSGSGQDLSVTSAIAIQRPQFQAVSLHGAVGSSSRLPGPPSAQEHCCGHLGNHAMGTSTSRKGAWMFLSSILLAAQSTSHCLLFFWGRRQKMLSRQALVQSSFLDVAISFKTWSGFRLWWLYISWTSVKIFTLCCFLLSYCYRRYILVVNIITTAIVSWFKQGGCYNLAAWKIPCETVPCILVLKQNYLFPTVYQFFKSLLT